MQIVGPVPRGPHDRSTSRAAWPSVTRRLRAGLRDSHERRPSRADPLRDVIVGSPLGRLLGFDARRRRAPDRVDGSPAVSGPRSRRSATSSTAARSARSSTSRATAAAWSHVELARQPARHDDRPHRQLPRTARTRATSSRSGRSSSGEARSSSVEVAVDDGAGTAVARALVTLRAAPIATPAPERARRARPPTAAARSPVTLSVVRHMSRKRSTPSTMPMPSTGTPIMPSIMAITGMQPAGHARGADAAEDAHGDDR